MTIYFNSQQLVEHSKKVGKEEIIILVLVKAHLIPHVTKKRATQDIFDVLVTLYKSLNTDYNMFPKMKFTTIHVIYI